MFRVAEREQAGDRHGVGPQRLDRGDDAVHLVVGQLDEHALRTHARTHAHDVIAREQRRRVVL